MNNNWQVFFKQRNNVNWDNFKKEMNFAEAGILYDISEMVNLGLSYKQLYFRNNDSLFYVENRIQLGGLISKTYSDLYFSFRNRLDYRQFYVKDSYFSYNNKFSVQYLRFPLQPIISEELFYNIEKPNVDTFRLTAGLYYKIKFLRIELYYGYQVSSSGELTKHCHAIGNTISFEF